MRDYELMVVFRPDLDESAVADLLTRINGWITEDGGEIVKTDVWGKRTLAYPIHKQNYGQYVLLHTRMAPTLGTKLERNLGYIEPVMRYMIVAKE